MHKYNDNWDGITRKTLTNFNEAPKKDSAPEAKEIQPLEEASPEEKAKQDAIDARIRKMNTDAAVQQVKEILDQYRYDKKQRAMIVAAIKNIKEETSVAEENLFEATTAKKTASSDTVQADDGETYKVKEIQAAVDAAKVVKANGITRGSSKKNFAHFKILYGLVNDMRSKKIPYDMDSFVELALKAASREGAAGAFKLLIGDFVGVGVPFAGWVDEFVPMNVSKTNDKKLKYYFDMWYGMASGDY